MRGIFLGLGSNLGERAANLERARAELAAGGAPTLRASAVRETEPFGHRDQPRFLNQVLEVSWEGSPEELRQLGEEVEVRLGRRPSFRWGPRLIDIDLLLFGERVVDGPGLAVPHPGLEARTFVLEPLLELEPDLVHPVTRTPLANRLRELARQS